ncbi:MAG: hypothetical protein HY815_20905 [Candidatus Riflebacteria bacterium]|nr:hypothetical protein [Candidatus Riflebacteria bacterium]
MLSHKKRRPAGKRCVRCHSHLGRGVDTCPSCNARVLSQMAIGQILVEEGALKQTQLEEALELQETTGRRLGNILTERGFVSEEAFARTLARQLDIPYFDLEECIIDPAVVALVPEHLCERYRLIPVMKVSDRLVVAFADPLNQSALADVHALTGLNLRVVVSTPGAINRALSQAFDAWSASDGFRNHVLGAASPVPSGPPARPHLKKIPR